MKKPLVLTTRQGEINGDRPVIYLQLPLTNDHVRILREFKANYYGCQHGQGDLAEVAQQVFNIAMMFSHDTAKLFERFLILRDKMHSTDEQLTASLLRKSKGIGTALQKDEASRMN